MFWVVSHVCVYSVGCFQQLVCIVTKDIITFLKISGSHVLELKILARVLANSLQIVTRDLIGTDFTYVAKGRSIQNNLHLVCQTLRG